jgi:hypothetical protein
MTCGLDPDLCPGCRPDDHRGQTCREAPDRDAPGSNSSASPEGTGGPEPENSAQPVWGLAPWPSLPAAALYGLAGEIARTIEPTSEADPAALLAQILVAYGSILGRTAHFRAEEDVHFLNEFAVLVGRTAKGRKGASWGRVRAVVEAADLDWARNRILSGLSSGEGLIEAVRDELRDKEGQIIAPPVRDKRLLAFEGEFASVLRQIERQGNTLSVTLRHAWDGTQLRTLTRNSPLCATGAHVSVIGHCTADELTRLLSSTEVANGFGNRNLWLCVKRSKVLPDGGSLDPSAVAPLQQRFKDAVEFGRTVCTMHRDDQARALWHHVYGPLSEGRPGLAGSLLARAEAHVMRLACIYALMDHSTWVQVEHLKAALALWDYVEASVRYVWGESLGDPVADEILRALRGRPDGMTRTGIRDLFNRNKPAEEIGRALAKLVEYRLARMDHRDTEGRPCEVWFAC